MGHDVLVDGYNVIKNNPMFRALEMKNLAAARASLIRQLQNRFSRTEHHVIVVFDGNGDKEQVSHEEHIRVVFSRYGEAADSVIIRLAAQARLAGREVEMYSDDWEVKQSVVEQGGAARTTEQLTTQLNAAPDALVHRVMHRQAMRRVYGIDPKYKGDDEPAPSQGRGKKRKKSARRQR
jgi:predicted RNA-binding protein with PIN domain